MVDENLRRKVFDHSNLFQSWKQQSVNVKHCLKFALVWPVYRKNTEVKWKWYRSNDYSLKWSFIWLITWKLLFSGEINLFVGVIKIWLGVYGGDFTQMGRDDQIFETDCSERYSSEPTYRQQQVSQENGLKRHLLSIKIYISFKCRR